ncbi:MAG: zf-HC2 domain-containing protein [Planctomycetes bacterium]|nr:zf-HC2 domain-containing protein [Planctomycetota bacterium]
MSEHQEPHGDVLQWLSRSLDGELPRREQILLDDHLDGCPRCQRVALDWRRLSSALRRDAAESQRRAPVGLDERILARIATEAATGGAAAATGAAVGGESLVESRAASWPRASDEPSAPLPIGWLRRSAALAAGLLLLLGLGWVASGPRQASAAARPSALEQADPALRRVLERWQRGRAAPPSFFELVLAGDR